MKHLLIGFVVLIGLQSCELLPSRKQMGKAVARVYDRYLYAEELDGLVPAGTSSKDSVEITGNYINNWIRQELLLHQAESNLAEEQMDFQKQVEQYRNSLIIFEYESELVRQKLDTTLSMNEIVEYYKKNESSFVLHENILRMKYVVDTRNSPRISRYRQLIRSDREQDKEKLLELCQMEGVKFQLDDQQWISFTDFSRIIPVAVSDQMEFLQRNSYLEVQDSSMVYMVRIKEYKIKESISPLSFEIDKIKAILLNKRKSELLSRMEEDIYSTAKQKKNFEIY